MKPQKPVSVRLPVHVVPETYELTLKPDLESFTFEGSETIHIHLLKSTNKITLHSKDLQIESAEIILVTNTPSSRKRRATPPIMGENSAPAFAEKIEYDVKAETATFTFKKPIPAGNMGLKLVFRGILTDSMRGFYRSSYEHDGQKKHMATTQFEATDARRAFPCFDEPAHKAVFKVTLVIPKHMTAVSNTLETSTVEHSADYKILEFSPSPKMSTYLLAFIVGEMEYVEGKTKDGVRIRIYATPGKKHQSHFALDVAVKTLEFYNDYFGIPYPLPVLDMIAIPDFTSAAMENWGAVTYRESALLVDPQNSSLQSKQLVALVIAHELAHQWFGNLVTMEWWTHLWLNEGFASYIEYLAVHHMFPEWDMWTQYLVSDLGGALQLDGLASTHPIEIEVHHPDEIGEIFDAVSYNKGSAVIRMLAEYLGEKHFRNGLRHYLKKHSYKNTVTEDLWDSLEYISKKPVRKIMANWTGKGGYPLMSVSQYKDSLKISQERFFSSAVSKSKEPDKTLWHVPVSVITDKTKKPFYQVVSQKSLSLPRPPMKEWFKLNAGESSFFRTRYTTEDLLALRKPIQEKQLSVRDRLGIVRDVFALAEAGYVSATDALELVQSYKDEDEYTVWSEIISGLATIQNLIYDQPYHEQYRVYCKNVLATIVKKVGWKKVPGESDSTVLLRSLVLRFAGHFGNMDIVKQAHVLFTEAMNGTNTLDPDIRSVVYGLAAAYGGPKEYKLLESKHKTEALHEEKNRLARALAQFRNEKLVGQALDYSFSKHVRPQDSYMIVVNAYWNYATKYVAWNFVKNNWEEILKRYDPSSHMLPRFLSQAESFHTKNDLQDFKKFVKTHPTPGADMAVRQTIESIESNIAWVKRDVKTIGKYLTNFQFPISNS